MADSDDAGETTTGAALVAEALKRQGVQWVFGVVGIPVTNIAPALQDVGIGYIGMRNEQAVSPSSTRARAVYSHAHVLPRHDVRVRVRVGASEVAFACSRPTLFAAFLPTHLTHTHPLYVQESIEGETGSAVR